MIKKKLILCKLENEIYKIARYSDDSMFTLALFLKDGLGFEPYIKFLENEERAEFSGNISYIEKKQEKAIIFIDDLIFPNQAPFIIAIDDLITILKEYLNLYLLGVDEIEITINEFDQVSVIGKQI
ncbi:MAG: hypothetical protein AB7F19_02320 [Candidatus Babeliales bacterium]